MINRIEDIDRIIKLVNEYSNKLKELIDLYNTQRKRKTMLIFYGGILFVIVYALVFSYLTNYSFRDFLSKTGIGIIIMVVALLGLLGFISYYMFNFFKESRSRTDIVDEIILTQKQLSHLISIGSQTREHLLTKNDGYVILELDLKLTEAENITSRALRIPYVKNMIEKDKVNNSFKTINDKLEL